MLSMLFVFCQCSRVVLGWSCQLTAGGGFNSLLYELRDFTEVSDSFKRS